MNLSSLPTTTIRIITIVIVIVAFIWMVVSRGAFEPVLAFFTAFGAFITTFFQESDPEKKHINQFTERDYREVLNKSDRDTTNCIREELIDEKKAPFSIDLQPQNIKSNRQSNNLQTTEIVEADDLRFIFEETGQLLITGESGVGKTISVMRLMRRIINRARLELQDNNIKSAIPIYFDLELYFDSDNQEQDLKTWLIAQLANSTRQSIRHYWKTILENRYIIPVLDNLNRSSIDQRIGCAKGIDKLCHDHQMKIIVCCRDTEYQELLDNNVKLDLEAAYQINPLTLEQAQRYVEKFPEQVKLQDHLIYLQSILSLDEGQLTIHERDALAKWQNLRELTFYIRHNPKYRS